LYPNRPAQFARPGCGILLHQTTPAVILLYNATNHPQFERPGDVFPSPVFGRIIDTQNKRRVVQLRVDF
jgi:hypothetical protein